MELNTLFFTLPLALGDLQGCPGAPLPLPPSGSFWSVPPVHQQYKGSHQHREAETAKQEDHWTSPSQSDATQQLDWTSLFPGSPCSMSGQVSVWGLVQFVGGRPPNLFHFYTWSVKRHADDQCVVPLHSPRGALRMNQYMEGVQEKQRLIRNHWGRAKYRSAVWIWPHWKATAP